MKPDALAKSGTERGEQRAVMAWAALQLKKWPCLRWLHHIPNGGSRGDDERSRMIRGADMKADGVKPGIYDLCLPFPSGGFHGLYIEMKKPGKINDTSDAQDEFRDYLCSVGYANCVCDRWQQATSAIEQYLNGEIKRGT